MKVYGLTGGIACGKSTVSLFFKECGVPVIDADESSKTILSPGNQAYNQVCETFGSDICHADGQINREKLGAIVFSDSKKLKQLEAITHPAIRLDVAKQLTAYAQSGIPFAIVEAALLVENGSYRQYAGLIVVSCQIGLQKNRLVKRNNFSLEEAQQRIQSQLPTIEKECLADWVIYNNHDLKKLRSETQRVLQAINDSQK